MKLIYKILLGYFLIVSIIGVFSTSILIYNIEQYSKNLDAYREREITSFAKVIDAFIPNKEALKNAQRIQKLFLSTTDKLPHVKRLTLHAQDDKSLQFTHIASSNLSIVGTPSHQEDIKAIIENKTTLLYEDAPNGDHYLDITYPITDESLHPIAALGVAVSLKSSDAIFEKAIEKMKSDAIEIILIAILISTLLALIVTIIISKKIIKPIEKLKKALVSASNHELTHEIKIDTNDEIGELAVEFNKMATELHTLYASMEDKITLKTKELEQQFLTDSLTGLENRYALFNRTKSLEDFHLAILDISAFKDINDVYGVSIGNKVLEELSHKYTYYLTDTNLELYRLSGDEMVILNPNILNEDKFVHIIESIVKKVEHEIFYFEEEDIEINISLHAGISLQKEYSTEKANIALIKAKASHSDYKIFNTHEEQDQANSIDVISKIKHAINSFGIVTYYQGIADKNGSIIKYEALVRMKDNGQIVSPYFFLDVAKKTKYYQEITRSVLFSALHAFKDRDELISINLCAEDIINLQTQEFIKEQLAAFHKPQNVIFELVESEDIHNIPELHNFILYVKNTGAQIAIDDFGTGYSNFAYLMDLRPDYLKIDGSLIRNIDKDERSKRIVTTIINFAHGLDITVIAEFIHSKEVLNICKDLGVDEFQGYYYSKPSELS